MRVLCPTCGGKGSIPDPKLIGVPMCYVGPNGEGCPYVFCQSCSGSGWVEKDSQCHCKPSAPSVVGPLPQNIVQPSLTSPFLPPPGAVSIYEASTTVLVG